MGSFSIMNFDSFSKNNINENNMKKILYLIMSCQKNEHRQRGILDSWGNGQDIFFYSEHDNHSLNVVKVCEENNVVRKQVSVFNKIKQDFHNKYDWFFFGDDDTFVNTKIMNDKLDEFNKDYLHGVSMCGNWGDLSYPSGGAGFLINNQIIHKFFDQEFPDVPHGDVAVGFLMRNSGVELMPTKGFCYNTPEHHKIQMENTHNFVTFHYIREPQGMMELYNICQKNLK